MAAFKFRNITLFLLTITIAPKTYAQKSLKEDKYLNFPITYVKKVITYSERKLHSEISESKYISFVSDSSVAVQCVHKGKVFEVAQIDSIYVIIISYSNHFFTYSGLTKPLFTKGDFVKRGQKIAMLKKDYDDRYCVDVYYSNAIENLDPAPLFGK